MSQSACVVTISYFLRAFNAFYRLDHLPNVFGREFFMVLGYMSNSIWLFNILLIPMRLIKVRFHLLMYIFL